jgi:hypothetical protein
VEDTLRRVAQGKAPIADLADMAAAMDLVTAAYAASPLPGLLDDHASPQGNRE